MSSLGFHRALLSIPAPIESLRFCSSINDSEWSEPSDFHPTDDGSIALKQTPNFQMDMSQQLINTDLDITLDNMFTDLIPIISVLGQETRPPPAHIKPNLPRPRMYPNPATSLFALLLLSSARNFPPYNGHTASAVYGNFWTKYI